MTTLTTRRMPVLFAESGAQTTGGIHGVFEIPHEAGGLVMITVRDLDRSAVAVLGPHVLSPSYLPSTPVEERVMEALRSAGVDVPLAQRVPSAVPLPVSLAGTSIPIVVVTLNRSLGLERLERIGVALRALRDEGFALIGIAEDRSTASDGPEMLAIVTVLLGAACDDDRVVELRGRSGRPGFALVPERDDAITEEAGCAFWNADAAGEMPHEILEQLRPFLARQEDGDNQDMKKKAPSSISITRFDKARLMRLLRSLDAAQENREEIEDLEHELERGTEVESREVAPDVVTMNSTVRVMDLDAQSVHVYTIVFPADADFEKGRISILSPLGTALLGYRAGDVVSWEMPRGTRRLRIEELVYQPEAAGDFHL